MNIYIAAAILIAVCLVLNMIFGWIGGRPGAFLIAIVGGALVAWLFHAGVQQLEEKNKPPECQTMYVC